ncbi:Uncharacterised protein [uncultured archaeon]|nr:Uncharacterised protein [uncultured archaeon]
MPDLIHFEIPADDVERAKKFYTDLFGWKLEKYPGVEYWMIDAQDGIGGGMMKRQQPDQKIVDHFKVASVLESSAKVEKLGGKVLLPKMAVPNIGYFAICMDTEGNVFGIFENDPQAKRSV